MRKILAIFWLFGCVALVQAQWLPVPVPTEATLFTVAFTDSLNGCVSGTGVILKTFNGGGIWQPVYLDPMASNLTDICFPTPQTGYAVGDYSIMKTTNGGDNWSPVWAPVGGIIRGVFFLNADTGWICAQGEEIWRTDDGGANWYNQMSGAYWLRQFDFPTPMLGFCVGDGGNIYKTNDGGENWILQTNATTTNLTDVLFLTADTGFVVGNDSYVAKTCDGGAT